MKAVAGKARVRTARIIAVTALLAAAVFATQRFAPRANALAANGRTELASINAAQSAAGNDYSNAVSISNDGQYVLFSSYATNLAAKDNNSRRDAFVRDLNANTTALVSVVASGTGASANDTSSAVALTPGGHYALFNSYATNLVSNDLNTKQDVYLRDLTGGTTSLVSVDSSGTNAANGDSSAAAITADGRYVLFTSSASNLVGNDGNAENDVFLRDMMIGSTTLVSVNAAGTASGNGPAAAAGLTPDGRYVVFTSLASDLTATLDTNGRADVFVRDLVAGNTILISTNKTGSASGSDGALQPVISDDGRYIAFVSISNDLVATTDANGAADVFVRDRISGTTELASAAPSGSGNAASGLSGRLAFSADGRFLLFNSAAGDLVANDNNGSQDAFVRDLLLDSTALVSVNSGGSASGNQASFAASMSSDGRYVLFDSDASDLVATDSNAAADVFVRDLMSGTTKIVSLNETGSDSGDAASVAVAIAGSRYVLFNSNASDLVTTADSNNVGDVFVRDLDFIAPTATPTPTPSSTRTRTATRTPTMSPTITPTFFTATPSSTATVTPTRTSTASPTITPTLLTATPTISATRSPTRTPSSTRTSTLTPTITATPSVTPILPTPTPTATRSASPTHTATATAATPSATPTRSATRSATITATPTLTPTLTPTAPTQTPTLSATPSLTRTASPTRSSTQTPTTTPTRTSTMTPTQSPTVAPPVGGVTDLISIAANGSTAGNSDSGQSAMSSDARYVAFTSAATNLVGNDNNAANDVFVRDRTNATTSLASLNIDGHSGNGASSGPLLTPDGRFLAFTSAANDLVAGDANAHADAFVRDLFSGVTSLVSAAANPGNGASVAQAISDDGRYVVFATLAGNFFGNDLNSAADVFVRDRQAATTTLVSLNAAGDATGNGASSAASISADGQVVAFVSDASDLVANDGNASSDVFVRTTNAGVMSLISVNLNGTGSGNGASGGSFAPVVSADGRYVTFISNASDLVANDSNGNLPDVFVRDRLNNVTQLISINLTGSGSGNGASLQSSLNPALSADGRFVLFGSAATDLVAQSTTDNGTVGHVFRRDRNTSTTTLVSINRTATAGGANGAIADALSADGRYVVFESFSSDLVGTVDANSAYDVFLRDLNTSTTTLVTADVSGTAPGNNYSFGRAVSGNGRFVLFESYASNITAALAPDIKNVFVRDLWATPSPTPSATRSATLTPTASPTATPSSTSTASATHSASPSPSSTATRTATPSATGSATPTQTSTATSTSTVTSTRTATASPSSTVTPTPTSTATATATRTPTATATTTPTPTATPTASPTATATATRSATPTRSASPTQTSSPTPSQTATASATPSATPSASPTATPSATPSATSTPTATASPTRTISPTASATPSASATRSATATATASPSSSATATASATRSSTATATVSPSPSASSTPSATPTASPTRSATPSVTSPPSATRTATATATPSATATATFTQSATASATSTMSATPSATSTASATRSPTPTASASPSASPSASATHSASHPPSATPSATATATATRTATAPASATATLSPTPSAVSTPTSTASATQTVSPTPPATPTASATSSPTASASPNPSATPTASSTVSPSASPSPSRTTTLTPTASTTASPSPSGTATMQPTASASATTTHSASPSATPSASPTWSPSVTASTTATTSATATQTASPRPSATGSATPSATSTASASSPATASATHTASPTPTPTASERPSLTASSTPTATPTPSASASPSKTLTHTPTVSASPTPTDTATHTASPTPTHTASATCSPTPSALPSRTPMRTATATATTRFRPTSTLTPNASPTSTPARPACDGDCDAGGDVTIDELIRLVNIALETAPLSACAVGDTDASGDITIDEIIGAVAAALSGCPGSG